jgi:hypothetical protein
MATDETRVWQVGDLLTVAGKSERRLIVSLTDSLIIVIAESGWWNTYQIRSEVPLIFHGNTGLIYAYKGREPLYQDFLKGVFTPNFTIN